MGNEAGQAGEKERLGCSQRLGQSAAVYGQYCTCLNPTAPRACPAPPWRGGCHRHPQTQQISSTSDPHTVDPAARERLATLGLQARARAGNCSCLMNCSSSLQQQIRAIKHQIAD